MARKKDPATEDLELVERSRAGDQEAFSRLVTKYEKRIYHLAYGMLGNRDNALDVTQEAFIKAYRALQGFRGGGGFHTWLYRITYNQAIDFIRKEGRRTHVEFDETYVTGTAEYVQASLSPEFNPGKSVAQKELSRVVMDAIQRLPEHHRAVIVLREVEGHSYQEIARILKIRKGTVMSRLHYARQQLQADLTPYIEEGKIREDR